jgi:hypothetical protein
MRDLGDRDPVLLAIGLRATHPRAPGETRVPEGIAQGGGVGEREMALYLVSIAEAEIARDARDARRTLSRALRLTPIVARCLRSAGSKKVPAIRRRRFVTGATRRA